MKERIFETKKRLMDRREEVRKGKMRGRRKK